MHVNDPLEKVLAERLHPAAIAELRIQRLVQFPEERLVVLATVLKLHLILPDDVGALQRVFTALGLVVDEAGFGFDASLLPVRVG